jgi:hypothetical protein
MREPAKQVPSGMRSMRACTAARSVLAVNQRKPRCTSAARRLRAEACTPDWRRTEMGTNHISCFGVWRRGARRKVLRKNRSGMTRWHMPHRHDAALTLVPGAIHEAAGEA